MQTRAPAGKLNERANERILWRRRANGIIKPTASSFAARGWPRFLRAPLGTASSSALLAGWLADLLAGWRRMPMTPKRRELPDKAAQATAGELG